MGNRKKVNSMPSVYQSLNIIKPQILAQWQAVSFAGDEGISAKKPAGPFADPVAYLIKKNTEAILEWLLDGGNDEDIFIPLEEICRYRAIEDIRPAEALKFVFALKQIIRNELVSEKGDWAEELLDIDKRIDNIALLAFDIYSKCRARICELRVKEIKRMYGRDRG
ncbi:MAG: hypothetical protein GX808_06820 [Syntrophomonadaceae bacterium]|jgi:hypothetical protein|nr:hypothetical protein [Syntrophomonadaceae bacterium]